MTTLQVAQRGEDILRLIAAPIAQNELNTSWLNHFIEAMHETMLARNGVGIAAPQVYLSKRIIIVASKPNSRYPDAPEMDAIVMINPEIIESSENKIAGEEGCLSVDGERGQVSRASSIVVNYIDIHGDKITSKFNGFPARIVQHEIDHLNGILFVDYLSN